MLTEDRLVAIILELIDVDEFGGFQPRLIEGADLVEVLGVENFRLLQSLLGDELWLLEKCINSNAHQNF